MSIPKKHHYLPEFYLSRWALNGQVFSYRRPQGAEGKLFVQRKYPSAVAYERDLYSLPLKNPNDIAQIELRFLQLIDDRAAIALRKLDEGVPGLPADRVALVQFLLSLLHRSPSRIAWIHEELGRRISEDGPFEHDAHRERVRLAALELFTDLVGSADMVDKLCRMAAIKIMIPNGNGQLLTSDRPTLLSNGLAARDGFLLLPYAPDKLVILVNDKRVAQAFAAQASDKLVGGINDAVVSQAQHMVIGATKSDSELVERKLLRSSALLTAHTGPDGLHRWKAPIEFR